MKKTLCILAVALSSSTLAQSVNLGGLEKVPQMTAPQAKNLKGLKPCMIPLGSGDTPAAKAALDKASKEIQAALAKYNVSLPACNKDSRALLIWNITPFRPVALTGTPSVLIPYTFGTSVVVISKDFPSVITVWEDVQTNTVQKDVYLNNYAAIVTLPASYEAFAKAYAANR